LKKKKKRKRAYNRKILHQKVHPQTPPPRDLDRRQGESGTVVSGDRGRVRALEALEELEEAEVAPACSDAHEMQINKS